MARSGKRGAAAKARAGTAGARATGMRHTMYVCRSCVWDEQQRERDGERQGEFLIEAIRKLTKKWRLRDDFTIRTVYCLNGCKSPCNVGFRTPGKYSLRFSRLTPSDAKAVLAFADRYFASADGDVPEGDWPAGLNGNLTVRTPPIRV